MNSGALGTVTTIVGGIIGLAIVAVIATHPTVISSFFSGTASAVKAAEAG